MTLLGAKVRLCIEQSDSDLWVEPSQLLFSCHKPYVIDKIVANNTAKQLAIFYSPVQDDKQINWTQSHHMRPQTN